MREAVTRFVPPLGILLRSTALLLSLALVGGVLVAWSGVYSVAANRGHWPFFEMFLEFGMRSSVRTHALLIPVPPLEDGNRVRRGAAHYQQGCAPCHGSPAGPSMQVVRAMLPEPSDLDALVPSWKPNELFWIVKSGLKYTGMPAWPAQQRDDEVWDVVAFLRELPDMMPEHYRILAGIDAASQRSVERHASSPDGRAALLESCARCHGSDGRGRDTTAFPRLDLQSEDWLLTQLKAYASGQRASGVMQAATAELTEREMAWLARHYATGQSRPKGSTPSPRPDSAPSSHPDGEALFLNGAPDQGIPACTTCHGGDATMRDRAYPALVGQYADYTKTQLTLYREGNRRSDEAAQLMSTIAARLTPEQIRSVAAYLAAQPAPSR